MWQLCFGNFLGFCNWRMGWVRSTIIIFQKPAFCWISAAVFRRLRNAWKKKPRTFSFSKRIFLHIYNWSKGSCWNNFFSCLSKLNGVMNEWENVCRYTDYFFHRKKKSLSKGIQFMVFMKKLCSKFYGNELTVCLWHDCILKGNAMILGFYMISEPRY